MGREGQRKRFTRLPVDINVKLEPGLYAPGSRLSQRKSVAAESKRSVMMIGKQAAELPRMAKSKPLHDTSAQWLYGKRDSKMCTSTYRWVGLQALEISSKGCPYNY